ncbi:MAG: universal stress protein [Myxococcota bacterium]
MSILLPIDAQAPFLPAMLVSAAIARQLQVDVDVLEIQNRPHPLNRLAYLHNMLKPIREQNVNAHLRITSGNPADQICRAIRERRTEWVVLNGGEDIPGRVAQAVMRRADAPVFVVQASPQEPGTVRLHCNNTDAAMEMLGRMQGAGFQWNRTGINQIAVYLPALTLQRAI